MLKNLFVPVALLAACPLAIASAETDTLQTLRQEIDQLKKEVRQKTNRGANSSSFNPDISLILSGTYADLKNNPEDYSIPGISLGEETGPGEEGLSLSESELVMSANIDDHYFGRFTAALTPENSIEVEEAYIQTLALPAGLSVQAGRFLSELGYLNSKHAHQWDFVDQPLVYRAFLANQYNDDGMQLRWLAPADQFLEIGMELFRGDSYPAGGADNHGKGSYSLFATTGGDVGESYSWQAGLSYLNAKAKPRSTEEGSLEFTGETKLSAVDLILKWAPHGNSYDQNMTVQIEYIQSREQGDYNTGGAINSMRRGWYTQAVYQFTHGWRVGLRYDRLSLDNPDSAFTGTVLDPSGHEPKRTSAMLDYAHSEFSRIRLQYNRDDSNPNQDNQWFLQYMMSMGAHGAHRY